MKQDHRKYTRAQLDYHCMAAITSSMKLYNIAIIMCLMELGIEPDKIKGVMNNSESLFGSVKAGTLSFEDCIEDIRKNTGIEVVM